MNWTKHAMWMGACFITIGCPMISGARISPPGVGRVHLRTELVQTAHSDRTELAGRSAAGPNRYRLISLGNLGGGSSVPTALNRAGWVVGYSRTRSGADHAFLYRGGRMADLGSLPGLPYSTATGINDEGAIVGTSSGPTWQSPSHAWIWRQGHFTDLGMLLHSNNSQASGINAAGHVVGWYSEAAGTQRGFLWDGRRMQILPVEIARCLNDRGDVVGIRGDWEGALIRNGTATNLQPGVSSTFMPFAINNRGQMVGHVRAQRVQAALYRSGRVTLLESREYAASDATGINDQGDAVGMGVPRILVDGQLTGHAVLWRRGRAIDLDLAIPGRRRWVIEHARAINDRGEIACWGYRVGHPLLQALLLTPVPGRR